ncbi:hypothetical protein ACLB0R_06880 [Sphingomonas sp. GlSt437]
MAVIAACVGIDIGQGIGAADTVVAAESAKNARKKMQSHRMRW